MHASVVTTGTQSMNQRRGFGLIAKCWGQKLKLQKNLLALAAGKPLTKVYDPTKKETAQPIFASLGRKQGVATLPFVNKFMSRWIKAPSLLVGIVYPNAWGVKGYKLSPAAMGPSPL